MSKDKQNVTFNSLVYVTLVNSIGTDPLIFQVKHNCFKVGGEGYAYSSIDNEGIFWRGQYFQWGKKQHTVEYCVLVLCFHLQYSYLNVQVGLNAQP